MFYDSFVLMRASKALEAATGLADSPKIRTENI
jgi:hypothetical protein